MCTAELKNSYEKVCFPMQAAFMTLEIKNMLKNTTDNDVIRCALKILIFDREYFSTLKKCYNKTRKAIKMTRSRHCLQINTLLF